MDVQTKALQVKLEAGQLTLTDIQEDPISVLALLEHRNTSVVFDHSAKDMTEAIPGYDSDKVNDLAHRFIDGEFEHMSEAVEFLLNEEDQLNLTVLAAVSIRDWLDNRINGSSQAQIIPLKEKIVKEAQAAVEALLGRGKEKGD